MTFILVNKVEARTGRSFDSFSVEGEVLYGLAHCPYRGTTHGHMSRVLCGLEESFIFLFCFVLESKHSPEGSVGWNTISLLSIGICLPGVSAMLFGFCYPGRGNLV